MRLLYYFVYICEQLYWYVTSHKWIPMLMTSSTVKYNKIIKIIFAFVLQCPKWPSEKCGICKSFHAWADKKVSAVLLIQCDYKGLLLLTLSDPTSDLVQRYDFPVPLQCRVTSDFFFSPARSTVGACLTLFLM